MGCGTGSGVSLRVAHRSGRCSAGRLRPVHRSPGWSADRPHRDRRTVADVASRSSTSSNSSCAQVRVGQLLPGPRCGDLGCVRPAQRVRARSWSWCALFWLQSSNTLPSRSVFFMSTDHQVGWIGLQRSGQFVGDRRRPASDELSEPSNGAYRWMPLLPLVTGTEVETHRVAESRATRCATSTHARPAHARAGVEVEHQPVGVAAAVVRPNRHCGTCSSSEASWASQASVAGSLTSG